MIKIIAVLESKTQQRTQSPFVSFINDEKQSKELEISLVFDTNILQFNHV